MQNNWLKLKLNAYYISISNAFWFTEFVFVYSVNIQQSQIVKRLWILNFANARCSSEYFRWILQQNKFNKRTGFF